MDLERSSYLIGKAEVRLQFQRAAVATMTKDVDPLFAALARELVCLMEEKILMMQRMHEAMVKRDVCLYDELRGRTRNTGAERMAACALVHRRTRWLAALKGNEDVLGDDRYGY